MQVVFSTDLLCKILHPLGDVASPSTVASEEEVVGRLLETPTVKVKGMFLVKSDGKDIERSQTSPKNKIAVLFSCFLDRFSINKNS